MQSGSSRILDLMNRKTTRERFLSLVDTMKDRIPGLTLSTDVMVGFPSETEAEYEETLSAMEAMGCTVTNRDFGCCGKRNALAAELMDDRERECAGADWIVVGCPLCLDRYDDQEGGLPVMHIAELVALAAGDCTTLDLHRIRKQ